MLLASIGEVLLSLLSGLGDILQSIGLGMGGPSRRKKNKQPTSGTSQ